MDTVGFRIDLQGGHPQRKIPGTMPDTAYPCSPPSGTDQERPETPFQRFIALRRAPRAPQALRVPRPDSSALPFRTGRLYCPRQHSVFGISSEDKQDERSPARASPPTGWRSHVQSSQFLGPLHTPSAMLPCSWVMGPAGSWVRAPARILGFWSPRQG